MGIVKEASSQAGLPADTLASVKEGSTSGDDIISLEPAKKYKFQGRELTGKDVIAKINRGVGYEEQKSELDKTRSDMNQLAEQNQFLLDLIKQNDENQKLQGFVDKAVKATVKKPVEDDEYDLDLNLEPETSFDINQYLQPIVEGIEKKYEAQLPKLVEKMFTERYGTELTKRQQEENDLAFIKSQEAQIMGVMNDEYSDFVETNPTEANKLMQKALDLQGRSLVLDQQYPALRQQGNPEWQNVFQEKLEIDNDRIKVLSELNARQKRASIQRQSEAVLSQGINPTQFKGDTPPKKARTLKEAEERKKETDRQIQAIIDAQKARQELL
jgi:hypothetical protein